ncbi:hypothetical protein [Turneriella parva]|uniref:Secreted protein n=1 Tax=Turneriella parva (strain ATCC BAA-1111 / DSM 21527 / NCTC 11395 / H) TaxID=869212 RepID=I4B4N5_TURPD|nr:hypothetical protein [Turneriella parva]AFM12242.1 secreted protein [Turneriella parva DSM 21527]
MKAKLTAIAAIISITAFLPALSAQVKGGSREDIPEKNLTVPPDVVAMPEGGFLSDIAGTWDCGDFGTVVLKQKGDKVTGTYGEDGKIVGILKNSRFTGTWSEAGGTARGAFDFKTSIERKTNRPTNLRGRWKNAGERKWQPAPWECVN